MLDQKRARRWLDPPAVGILLLGAVIGGLLA